MKKLEWYLRSLRLGKNLPLLVRDMPAPKEASLVKRRWLGFSEMLGCVVIVFYLNSGEFCVVLDCFLFAISGVIVPVVASFSTLFFLSFIFVDFFDTGDEIPLVAVANPLSVLIC